MAHLHVVSHRERSLAAFCQALQQHLGAILGLQLHLQGCGVGHIAYCHAVLPRLVALLAAGFLAVHQHLVVLRPLYSYRHFGVAYHAEVKACHVQLHLGGVGQGRGCREFHQGCLPQRFCCQMGLQQHLLAIFLLGGIHAVDHHGLLDAVGPAMAHLLHLYRLCHGGCRQESKKSD